MNTPQIVLASASPRRKELLKLLGLNFIVHPSNFNEESLLHLPPKEFALQTAIEKSNTLINEYDDSIILAADTIVTLDKIIFGKPASTEEAEKYLRALRGKTHEVISGISVIYPKLNLEPIADIEITYVKMRDYSDKEIDDYIQTKEPMDKAGAYGIQGHGGALIEKIDGCFFNVVGLPIYKMLNILSNFFDTKPYFKNIPQNFKFFK